MEVVLETYNTEEAAYRDNLFQKWDTLYNSKESLGKDKFNGLWSLAFNKVTADATDASLNEEYSIWLGRKFTKDYDKIYAELGEDILYQRDSYGNYIFDPLTMKPTMKTSQQVFEELNFVLDEGNSRAFRARVTDKLDSYDSNGMLVDPTSDNNIGASNFNYGTHRNESLKNINPATMFLSNDEPTSAFPSFDSDYWKTFYDVMDESAWAMYRKQNPEMGEIMANLSFNDGNPGNALFLEQTAPNLFNSTVQEATVAAENAQYQRIDKALSDPVERRMIMRALNFMEESDGKTPVSSRSISDIITEPQNETTTLPYFE